MMSLVSVVGDMFSVSRPMALVCVMKSPKTESRVVANGRMVDFLVSCLVLINRAFGHPFIYQFKSVVRNQNRVKIHYQESTVII